MGRKYRSLSKASSAKFARLPPEGSAKDCSSDHRASDSLSDSLEEISAIVSGDQPNRRGLPVGLEASYDASADDEHDAASLSSDDSQPSSELEELMKSLGDTITSLFRTTILIRSATTRDRYSKAASAAGEPYDPKFDIAHVGHKFPRIHKTAWLETRFGKAITQRRQYLQYCREHREKTGVDQKSYDSAQNYDSRQNRLAMIDEYKNVNNCEEKSHAQSKRPSTLAITNASTLNVAALERLDENLDEVQSQTFYATSPGEDERKDGLRVPPLPDAAGTGLPFECP